ncbi:MAG: CIA30 family protein [Verrucomicrobia bacterium]|nr:CIA30 family protein [Verrucomicrobiota bacterium]
MKRWALPHYPVLEVTNLGYVARVFRTRPLTTLLWGIALTRPIWRRLALFSCCPLLFTMPALPADQTIFDFSRPGPLANWQVVNDDVMGGVSSSRFLAEGDVAVFSGTVSLENNGGFASVRSSPGRWDLVGCQALVVRARGDGRRYKLTVRASTDPAAPLYQAAFTTTAGVWQEFRLPLESFVPTFRGRTLAGEPPLDPRRIVSVGLLISDKQAGPFRLEVAWIGAGGS